MLLSLIVIINETIQTFSNRGVHAPRGIMGNQGKIANNWKRQNNRFSSYFRSEFHFREETFTVNRETLLAFLSRLAYLSE